MTIYLWEIPESYPEKLIGRYERERSPNSFLFDKGIKLNQSQVASMPIIKFTVKKQKLLEYDCLDNTSMIPLVNHRLADLLVKLARDDVQFFDAKIECTDGELEGYKLLNITHAIQGIDHEKSVYTKMKQADAILGFKYLTYKPGCMGNYQLARDEEYKGHLLATQAIYDAFKREKITGAWLATPEEFYDLVHGRG